MIFKRSFRIKKIFIIDFITKHQCNLLYIMTAPGNYIFSVELPENMPKEVKSSEEVKII